MSKRTKYLLFTGLLIGSLWAFSEVVLGTMLRAVFLRMRGTLLTGIGVGILLAGFGYTRQVRVVTIAVLTAVFARVVFASLSGSRISLTNGSLAVLFMGILIVIAIWILKPHPLPGNLILGFTAAIAILCSGTLFYIVGSRFDPCPYLRQFSAWIFFLRETVLWGLFSAMTAPMGYRVGVALSRPSVRLAIPSLPPWCIIVGCWLCCGLTMILSS